MNKRMRKNVKEKLKKCPAVSLIVEAAIKGQAKRKWYSNARQAIAESYGDKAKLFTGLLAATSPRQRVDKNLVMTKRLYAMLELTGDAIDYEEIARITDLEARRQNVVRVVEGKELSGPKVTAFNANLCGDYEAVTIDTWMLTFAGLAYEKNFLTKSGHIAYQHRVKRAAKRLGWHPAEVQAAVWSYCYSKVNKCTIEEVPEFEIGQELELAEDSII